MRCAIAALIVIAVAMTDENRQTFSNVASADSLELWSMLSPSFDQGQHFQLRA
jgi:hypothetical protein